MLFGTIRLINLLTRQLPSPSKQVAIKFTCPVVEITSRQFQTSCFLNERVPGTVNQDEKHPQLKQAQDQLKSNSDQTTQDDNKSKPAMDQDIKNPADESTTIGSRVRLLNLPKVSGEVKRLRRNHRLRKILVPKNALMSLYEIVDGGSLELKVVPEEQHGFLATILVNNVQYKGHGNSKIAAKNDAAEKAMRDIVIQRMMKASRETETNESDVPMSQLASFALHQLYSDWKGKGFDIPDYKEHAVLSTATEIESLESATSIEVATIESASLESASIDQPIRELDASSSVVSVSGDTKPGDTGPSGTLPSDIDAADAKLPPAKRIKLPDYAESMHPAALLRHIYPAVTFIDLGSHGDFADELYHVGVDIDGVEFVGTARSKKSARKFAAIDACNRLLGTAFVKDKN